MFPKMIRLVSYIRFDKQNRRRVAAKHPRSSSLFVCSVGSPSARVERFFGRRECARAKGQQLLSSSQSSNGRDFLCENPPGVFPSPDVLFLFCSFFPPCTALKSNAFEVEQIAAYRVSTECVAGAQTRVNTKEAPATTTRHSTAK